MRSANSTETDLRVAATSSAVPTATVCWSFDIQRISGEAGDGFCKDHVDLALSALADHTQEILAPAGGGSRDTLIREDIHHCPLRIFHDLFGVEGFLVFMGSSARNEDFESLGVCCKKL